MVILQQQAAIVTGAASGIGKAVAKTLSAAGARVLLCDRDRTSGDQAAQEIAESGGHAAFLEADLADPAVPEQIVEAAVRNWGRIDIVVNSAAVVCTKPVESITHGDWDKLFAVNLKAPFFITQAALPWLIERGGSVIQISSINSLYNVQNNLVYDTLKAALNHMTKGLALDLRSRGVRFNAVLPGGTATPMLDAWLSQIPGGEAQARQLAEEAKRSPHVADPQRIADAVLLLASGQASWINGALVPVDGGKHLG